MRTIRQFHSAEKRGGKFHSEESQRISGCSKSVHTNNSGGGVKQQSIYQSRTYHHHAQQRQQILANRHSPHSHSYHGHHNQRHVPLAVAHSNTTYTNFQENGGSDDISSVGISFSKNTTAANTPKGSISANNTINITEPTEDGNHNK